MQSEDPGKRIPTSIATDKKLFGRYTLTDVAVAAFPGVLVALAVQGVVPPSMTVAGVRLHSFTLPLAGVAVAGGALFVYLTPQHTSSIDWFGRFLAYSASRDRRPHDEARSTTHVERLYPEHDVIERTDGALVGVVKVHPPTMALATTTEWTRKAEAFQEFLNTTVEFPIQLYSTTRAFEAGTHVARYERRLDDPDVEANPTLERLIEGYVDWHLDDCDSRPMTIRDHYIVVPVSPADVQFEERSFTAQIAALPVVGVLMRALFGPPRSVERQAMLDALEERLRRVTAGMREIQGCEAHRVPIEDATRLLGEYWTGTEPQYGSLETALRTSPMVATEADTP